MGRCARFVARWMTVLRGSSSGGGGGGLRALIAAIRDGSEWRSFLMSAWPSRTATARRGRLAALTGAPVVRWRWGATARVASWGTYIVPMPFALALAFGLTVRVDRRRIGTGLQGARARVADVTRARRSPRNGAGRAPPGRGGRPQERARRDPGSTAASRGAPVGRALAPLSPRDSRGPIRLGQAGLPAAPGGGRRGIHAALGGCPHRGSSSKGYGGRPPCAGMTTFPETGAGGRSASRTP